MVSVTVFQPEGQDVNVLATATVNRGRLQVEGRRTDLIDTGRSMFSSRAGDFVAFEDDREEWLRSFAESFRSAQVVAAIVKDTQHKELVAPSDVRERLEAQLAGAR